MLKGEQFERWNRRPVFLREELIICEENEPIIIDEVQKVPQLLDEINWLITNRNLRFILCGSSARKIKRSGANLPGGRAVRNVLFPLVSAEIPDFNLDMAINKGMLNFNNIASQCGVSAPTIREYFSILEDTLIGYMIPSYKKVIKRRFIQAPRFYNFDVGITNHLLNRKDLVRGSPEYGKAFEQFVMQELYAYCIYHGQRPGLSDWRTASGYEVDAVLGDAQIAIEIKSSREIHSHHVKGLKAFAEEHPDSRRIIVSHEPNRRIMSDIEIFPVLEFLRQLWTGAIIAGNA